MAYASHIISAISIFFKLNKMEKIIKYKTIDGEEFFDKKEASNHEDLISEMNIITEILKPTPKEFDMDFANGNCYIQQDIFKVQEVKVKATDLYNKLYREYDFIEDIMDFGRQLSDSSSPLYALYCRLSNIDFEGKEWGQTYFALNPEKGTQKEYKDD